jgi:hypothetical protein
VKTWLKGKIWTQMSEAPASALDRTTSAIKRNCSRARLCSNTGSSGRTRVRSSTLHVDRVSRVALAAIASCLRRVEFQSGYVRSIAHLMIERSVIEHSLCDRAHLTWQQP